MREALPFSLTIVQEWSGAPVAVVVTAIVTPFSIAEIATVRPRASEQAIVRTPFAVVSATAASGLARSSKEDGATEKPMSDRNQTKPETCPARGEPSEIRNRTDPDEGPSISQVSQPQASFASTDWMEYRRWSAVPVQSSSLSRETVAVAVSRPSAPVTTTFVSKREMYSFGMPRSRTGVQPQTNRPVSSQWNARHSDSSSSG